MHQQDQDNNEEEYPEECKKIICDLRAKLDNLVNANETMARIDAKKAIQRYRLIRQARRD